LYCSITDCPRVRKINLNIFSCVLGASGCTSPLILQTNDIVPCAYVTSRFRPRCRTKVPSTRSRSDDLSAISSVSPVDETRETSERCLITDRNEDAGGFNEPRNDDNNQNDDNDARDRFHDFINPYFYEIVFQSEFSSLDLISDSYIINCSKIS